MAIIMLSCSDMRIGSHFPWVVWQKCNCVQCATLIITTPAEYLPVPDAVAVAHTANVYVKLVGLCIPTFYTFVEINKHTVSQLQCKHLDAYKNVFPGYSFHE